MYYSHPNPPQDVSHSTSQVGTSTSYTSQPTHKHVHGHSCSGFACIGAASNPYYPFPGPPPTTPAPPTTTPQPQANVVQPAPPQG
jgi:hypothetical protein